MIINSNELTEKIREQIKEENNSIIIVSAFCKIEALKFIENNISSNVKEKKILLRWRLEDIKCKATDIEIYKFCKENGWELYINFDIHAKIYMFNRIKCIIGSSNLTVSGMNLHGKGNIEINTLVYIEEKEVCKIVDLFDKSYKMNDYIFNMMLDVIENKSNCNFVSSLESWGEEINQLLSNNEIKFFSYELLDSASIYSISKHDLDILNLKDNATYEEIRQAFLKSKIYRWIEKNVEDAIYFGKLSYRLHNDILDNPCIYRMNVKKYLRNILSFIVELQINSFVVDRPNHSQRIRRI